MLPLLEYRRLRRLVSLRALMMVARELLLLVPRVVTGFGLDRLIGGDKRGEKGDGDVPIGDAVYLKGRRGRGSPLEAAELAAVAGPRSRCFCH